MQGVSLSWREKATIRGCGIWAKLEEVTHRGVNQSINMLGNLEAKVFTVGEGSHSIETGENLMLCC